MWISYQTTVRAIYLFFYIPRVTSLFLGDSFQWIDEEIRLIEVLQNYMDVSKERLDNLKKYQDTLVQHAKLYASDEEFAHNPLAVYKTVKHLTVDFENVESDMIENRYNDAISKVLEEENIRLPEDRLLQDAVRDLVHLQRVNNLTIVDLTEGRLAPNVTVGQASLKPDDCFIIGRTSAKMHDHETAVNWLPTCEDRYEGHILNPVSAILISSSLLVGDLLQCRKSVHRCLRKDRYNRVLEDLKLKVSKKLGKWQNVHEYNQWQSFKICAGDYDSELSYRKLICRYNHHNSPFLTIAPLKEELLSLVPMISVFREAVHDDEIERLKSDVYDELEPGAVLDGEGGLVLEPRFFPSYRAHISLLESEYTQLRRRVIDMTSLSYDEEETLQIIYYTPGGFIRVHGDFLEETDEDVQTRGHRIAQAVLYLSDVILGGQTVFPQLKLSIQPVKGSVAVWTNSRIDGREEPLTYHAGCPVIYGEKIIGTQWFRMIGQDNWITKPRDYSGN